MMILATKLHVGKNKELVDEMSVKCFPDRMVMNGVSPAEIRTLRKIVGIVDLPIKLLAQAYFEYVDEGMSLDTMDELRLEILADEDYKKYFKRSDPVELRQIHYFHSLRPKVLSS